MSEVWLLVPYKAAATNTVYGAGHMYSTLNETETILLRNDGKAALVSAEARQVVVTALATTTATIQWVMDQSAAGGSRVEYGTTTSLGSTTQGTPSSGVGPGVCSANLTGLTTGTLYYFRITTGDAAGKTSFGPSMFTFRTL